MRSHLTVYLVALAVAAANIYGQEQNAHSGKIVDAATDKPLPNVTATAYGTNERKDNGLCPQYAGFLAAAISSKEGTFTLRIQRANVSYLITYCNPRYATFTHGGNDNSQDGSVIDPMPIRLFSRSPLAGDMLHAIALLRDDGRSSAIASRNTDSQHFEAMLGALPEPEKRLVHSWVSKPSSGDLLRAPNALSLDRLTRGVRATLEYFRTTDSKAFDSALPQFPEISLYASETRLLPDETDSSSRSGYYLVSFGLPHNPAGDVTGRQLAIAGDVLVEGEVSWKRATAELLRSRGHIVVALVSDPKAGEVAIRRPIAVDEKGHFSADIDLGEPIRGQIRELELTVIVATPRVLGGPIKNLMALDESSLSRMMTRAPIHQSSADD